MYPMHILWVIAKLFFLLSLAPAVGVLVGFPLFLLNEQFKMLWTEQPGTAQDGLVSFSTIG
jgi:hypothetical protein